MILIPGTLVRHPGQPSWGPGEVLPGGVAGKVRIRFAVAGEKTLSLSHVQLEVVAKADVERAFQLLQGKEPCVFVTGRAGSFS